MSDSLQTQGACQAPLSMGFSRQEYWSGLPFPSPGDLLNPGMEPRSPELQADSLPTELWGKLAARFAQHVEICFLYVFVLKCWSILLHDKQLEYKLKEMSRVYLSVWFH